MKLLILLLLYFTLNTHAASYTKVVVKILETYISEVLDATGNGTECGNQLKIYLADIKNPKMWALQMLDSTAKLQPGVLTGNLMEIGNFDECLEINVHRNGSQIKGQYCRSTVTPSQTLNECIDRKLTEKQITRLGKTTVIELQAFVKMSWDICVPAACSAEDLQDVWDYVQNRYDFKFSLTFREGLCTTIEKQSYYSPLNITAIAIFVIIGLAVLSSTFYDIFIFQKRKVSDEDYNFFMAFSYYTNGKRLLSTKNTQSEDDSKITCLHGIKVISIAWIILGHRYLLYFLGTAINFTYAGEWLKHPENMFIMGAFACVDSFFVISGFLIVYVIMVAKENGIKVNLVTFYVHRFLRLMPSLSAVVLVYVGILPHLGSGPFWNYTDKILTQDCIEHWWSTLLFIQNYVHPINTCMIQSWYLAVDTQLYVLSPLLYLPLQRWPKTTIAFIISLIFVSIGFSVYAAYHYEIDSLSIQSGNNFYKYLYNPTHIRMGPWLAGILLGYFMFQSRNKKIIIKKGYVLLLWTACLILMLFIIYGYIAFFQIKFTILMIAVFFGFSRLIWGVCICWVLFACTHGFGGFINKFLSLHIFNILARLTFTMYLTHALIVGVVQGQRGTTAYLHNLFQFYEVWGDFAFTIGLSTLWTLTFESPVTILEKVFIKKALKKNNELKEINASKTL